MCPSPVGELEGCSKAEAEAKPLGPLVQPGLQLLGAASALKRPQPLAVS